MRPTVRQICAILGVATACLVAILLTHAFVVWTRTPDPPPPVSPCREAARVLWDNGETAQCDSDGQTVSVEPVGARIFGICRCPRRSP